MRKDLIYWPIGLVYRLGSLVALYIAAIFFTFLYGGGIYDE